MSKLSRIVVLVTALTSVFAVTSSTTGAVRWTNAGSTSFHATAGPATLGVTGSGGTNNFSCTTSTATGSVPSGAFTLVAGTMTSTGCFLGLEIGCSYTLVPQSISATVPAVTASSMTLTCSMAAGMTPICHIEGTTPVHYVNPSGAIPGRITVTASSTLRITSFNGTSSCSVLLGTFTSGTIHLTEHTYTLTGGGPIISRDA